MLKKPLVLALFTAYAASQTAYANQNMTQLDQIMVSATKTETSVQKVAATTKVITQADIEAIGANSLKDIFQNMPGVFINPSADNLSIRGVGGKGTLLLIDGRRLGGEYNYSYEANRISAGSIERIEIVKGPMGSLYGSSALGGVVNIITKKPEDGFEGSIALNTGSNSDGQGAVTQLDADVRGRNGKTGYAAWFSAQKSEAYTEDETAMLKTPRGGTAANKTDKVAPSLTNNGIIKKNVTSDSAAVKTTYQTPAETINVGGQLTHEVSKDLTLRINASYMKETREADLIGGAFVPKYTHPQNGSKLSLFNVPIHQELDNERVDLGVGADYVVSERLKLNWQSSQSHYKKQDAIGTPLWKALGYSSQADSVEAGLNGAGESIANNHQLTSTWIPSDAHRVLMGAESVEDKRIAEFFSGGQTKETKSIQTSSVFAQHEWQLTEPLSVVYGARFDDNSNDDEAVTFNAGGVYQFSSAANLRLRYAQGFRSPDSQEVFMNRLMPNGKLLYGSEVIAGIKTQAFELKPEHSNHYEIGLQGQGKGWSYDVAAYQNEITDSLVFDNANIQKPGGYRTFKNASKVDISGVELSVSKKLIKDLRMAFYANVLNSKDQDSGKRLELTPNEHYNLTLDYQVTPALNTLLVAQYVGDQIYSEGNQYKTADAYTPVNLKLNYSPEAMKNTDFFAGIDNILDTEVDKELGSSVGTYYYGGVRVYF